MTFRIFLALIVLLLVALFGVQNRDSVVFHLLVWEVSAPAAIAIIIAFVAGAFTGGLLAWREQRRVRRYEQQIARATVATAAAAPPPPAPVPLVPVVPLQQEKKPERKIERKKRSWW